MNSPQRDRAAVLSELLTEIRALPVDQQAAVLQARAGDDPQLKAVVQFLLAEPQRMTQGLMPANAQSDGSQTEDAAGEAGDGSSQRIGRYKLLQKIGEGGFGTVFMAEQERPIRRTVAVKIINPGMDTRQVIARFEAERQALAMMDHPSIAKVLDAGATPAGRPYFAMELVRGIPITEYCDKNNLSIRERLELFVPVCQAVQHAHQKGIIHRDLKPTNVLITLHDGKPVPKVIDFGIAKATQSRLTDKTLFTEYRHFMGTPQYMSPEQAEMSGLDVDTRADVYSLGVMLYELLTGSTPFDPKELRSKGQEQIQKMIREVEPPRPSTRLGTLGEQLTAVASHRKIDPKKLGGLVRGEVDWIVMKCLEKDRTRRYETANALAMDVRRYLDSEPVLARPATVTYRARKVIQRHRGKFATAALVFLALIVGLCLATVGFIHARVERDRAIVAQKNAEQAKSELAAGLRLFHDASIYEAAAVPQKRKNVEQAEKRIQEGWLADQPQMAAAIRTCLGYYNVRRQFYAQAEEHFKVALALLKRPDGTFPPEASPAMRGFGIICLERDDMPSAEKWIKLYIDTQRQDNPAADVGWLLMIAADIREKLGDTAGKGRLHLEAQAADVLSATQVLAEYPNDYPAIRQRAWAHLQLAHFKDAASDFKRATALSPGDHDNWSTVGALQLYLGDDAGYRETARSMLLRFGDGKRVDVGERMAKLCCLTREPVGDIHQLQTVMERVVAVGTGRTLSWYQMSRGLVEYRAKNYPVAVKALQEAIDRRIEKRSGRATALLLMAMCHHQMGHEEDARLWFSRAGEVAATIIMPDTDMFWDGSDYAIYEILRREAEAMAPAHAPPATRPTSG